MPTAKELREQRAQTWERMKEIVELAEGENRDLSAEEESNWNTADEALRAFDKRIERQERLERQPANDNRSIRTVETATMDRRSVRATPEYKKAWTRWLVFGNEGLLAEERSILQYGYSNFAVEQRALSVGASTAGGYLAPDDFVAQIETAEAWFGGMREVAQIIRTENGNDLSYPMSNDTGNTGRIIGENATLTQTDPTFQLATLKAFMYSSDLVLLSYALLQDEAIGIEAYLADILAERLGRITNTHFTTGVGPNQPRGIVGGANTGVTAAATGAVTADEIIDLVHSLNIAYRRGRGAAGPRWMFHDLTLREVRQLKDGVGNYMWRPGMSAGEPDTLYGYPYTINNDMPQMATGNTAFLFGQLNKYKIRDVRGIQLVRLDERYADQMSVGFFAFSRHDGMLINAGGNPVQALVMA